MKCKPKKRRKTDDKQSFISAYFVSTSNGQDSKINVQRILRSIYTFQKVKDNVFSKYNSIQEDFINK